MSSPFRTSVLGVLLAIFCVSSARAAEIFQLENSYDAGSVQLNQMAEGDFFWLERGHLPDGRNYFRLAGRDALTGADIFPRMVVGEGYFGSPYIFPHRLVVSGGEGWVVADRETGDVLGQRHLVDPVIGALLKDDVLTLVQSDRRGGSYLSRFALPGMRFIGEMHPAFLDVVEPRRFFGDRIVGIDRRSCPGAVKCPVDVVIASMDGEEISRVALPHANDGEGCMGLYTIVDVDGPRIALEGKCRYFVVDLQQQRLLQTFTEFPRAHSWFTFSGDLVFMRPEGGTVAEAKAKSRGIWIFDPSGRELAQADLDPGQIKAFGNKLISSPYASRKILVYAINRAAFSR